MADSEPEPGPIKFELVEGATFTLSDGSAVTVRGNELELSDGRTLPMPAAGETITVERTETRPDGTTVRIKHTIRLSETPAEHAAADAGGDGGSAATVTDEGDVPAEENGKHDEKTDEKDVIDNKGTLLETDIDEIRTLPETPASQPAKPVIMGLSDSGKRSLRSMLWGSIPESDDVTTYTPTQDIDQSNPRSLLHPQQSIMEADESEEDDHPPEAPDASENANESFEWDEKQEKPGKPSNEKNDDKDSAEEDDEPRKDVAAAVADAAENAGKIVAFSLDLPSPPGRQQEPATAGRESSPEDTSESSTVPADELEGKEEQHHDKPMLTRQYHIPSSNDLLKNASDVIIASVGIPTEDESISDKRKPPEDNPKPEQNATPEGTKPTADSQDPPKQSEQTPDEKSDNLSLKLALRNLEEQVTKDTAGSDDREDNTPPNTPAVNEVQEPEPVSVPKAIRYYESRISPAKQPWSSEDAPPRVRDDTPPKEAVVQHVIIPTHQQTPPHRQQEPAPIKHQDPPLPGGRPIEEPAAEIVVPKVVNFAVAMRPEKVYLSNQEPEEMENIPIPTPQKQSPPNAKGQEPVTEVACKPEVIQQAHTVMLVPVRAQPTSKEAPYRVEPDTEDGRDTENKPDALKTETQPEETPAKKEVENEKPKPREYDPTLFEHEPKQPLLITSETEAAPPYETGPHDSRTLPMSRKAELATVVTEQPPPFHHEEDREYDPKDPFLPDNPVPGTGKRDDGWIGVCLDLCCCCWAP